MFTLSVIVPTYNEEKNIEKLINKIFDVFEKNSLAGEIIVIDDSTDKTYGVLKRLEMKNSDLKVVHRNKRGFGSALQLGFELAKNDILIVFMGDFSDNPECIPAFLEKFEEGYKAVFGSRFVPGANVFSYPRIKLATNRLFNLVVKFLFRSRVNDFSSSFKAYRKEVVKSIKIESRWFEASPEVALKVIKSGVPYCQIPVNWYGRTVGEAKFSIKPLKLLRTGLDYGKVIFKTLTAY